jgi:hypothetical protein
MSQSIGLAAGDTIHGIRGLNDHWCGRFWHGSNALVETVEKPRIPKTMDFYLIDFKGSYSTKEPQIGVFRQSR